jgi:hypothetical protein
LGIGLGQDLRHGARQLAFAPAGYGGRRESDFAERIGVRNPDGCAVRQHLIAHNFKSPSNDATRLSASGSGFESPFCRGRDASGGMVMKEIIVENQQVE